MIRLPIAALAGLALLVPDALAAPASGQPLALSPDVNDPWLVHLVPGKQRPAFPPPQTTRFFLFGKPATQSPMTLTPQPTQLRAPGGGSQGRQIDPRYLPQTVAYATAERPGTIVIDTNARYLYLVIENGQALRYGVGVGRPGFEWAGVHKVTRKAEWPDWTPPAEMLQRQPGLPRFMKGGPNNPLGARALYLGSTLYRIHGSNEPWTIGHAVSSGCIRMRNEDVTDLYGRVGVGAKVIVI
jgi:lipoprotein-anchoring transpeptidase ErfK/SrfK